MSFIFQAYDNVLGELSKLERQDRDRRQKEIQNLPVQIEKRRIRQYNLFDCLIFRRAFSFLLGDAKKSVKKNKEKWKQRSNKFIKIIIENVKEKNKKQTLISNR